MRTDLQVGWSSSIPRVSYPPLVASKPAKAWSFLSNGRISREQAQLSNTFQAYASLISVCIKLAKSIHLAKPKVKGQGNTLCPLWEELQSYMAKGMGPGNSEEFNLFQYVELVLQS